MSAKPEEAKQPDPLEAWRSLRDVGVGAWAKTMVQTVNTEEYAKASGAMLDAYLSASGPIRETIVAAMGTALQQLNMPALADITSLAERLTNIEMHLDDMDAKLDTIIQQGRTPSAPPKSTRREGAQGDAGK